MTATDSIDLRIKTFKASSSFTPGDPLSFSIKLSEDVQLPGRYDPDEYLQRLGADLAGKNVLVVCPGNGGLCAAAINAGASTVVALEPRNLYARPLNAVASFTSEVTGTTFSQRSLGEKLVEKFDVAIWPEGVDEIVHPKNAFESVLGALAPGGMLYLELAHAHHGKLPDQINSWRPSKSAFEETLADYASLAVVSELEGRNQIRTIYTIKNTDVRVEVLPGPDYESVEDVQEFADKLKGEIQDMRKEHADKATPFVSKEFVQKEILNLSDEEIAEAKKVTEAREHEAARRVAEKIKQIIPTETPSSEDFDSVYEGQASTPKSKKKKKTKKKRGKPKP